MELSRRSFLTGTAGLIGLAFVPAPIRRYAAQLTPEPQTFAIRSIYTRGATVMTKIVVSIGRPDTLVRTATYHVTPNGEADLHFTEPTMLVGPRDTIRVTAFPRLHGARTTVTGETDSASRCWSSRRGYRSRSRCRSLGFGACPGGQANLKRPGEAGALL